MLRIGDFSRLAQVSGRTLRYYDQLNLLKPTATDALTGYRYYSIEQLPRLNRILALKDLGFELDQIAGLLDTDLSSPHLRDYLLDQERELEAKIAADQERLQRVRTRLQMIAAEEEPILIDVTLKQVEARRVVGNRQVIPGIRDIPYFARLMFSETYRWLRTARVAYGGGQLLLYHNDEYVEQDFDIEAAVFVDEIGGNLPPLPHPAMRIFELPPEPLMATTIHQGRLRDAAHTTLQLIRWCEQHGYRLRSEGISLREIHHFEASDRDLPIPESGIMELQLPVTKSLS